MTAILGISAYYHDSAAALATDAGIVAAAQEERFSRIKHDPGFPTRAARYCLEAGGLSAADLDWVAFYDKPVLKFERLLETYLAHAPVGLRSFSKAMPQWLGTKLFLPRLMREELRGPDGRTYRGRFVFPEHHESHAASAFFPSPFDEAAILTVDGVGEWATASVGAGRGNRIALSSQLRFPHSLGLLYSAFTYYLGFKVNAGEYKVMGLAPYGEPLLTDFIYNHLIDLREDGSFRMDQSYFRYSAGLTMTSPRFHRLFGGPPRRPESELTDRHMAIAASIQKVAEDVMLRMARHAARTTGLRRLCLAGGVALNCVANGRILREGPFEEVWIQPAAGDAGGALGAALFVRHQLLNRPRDPCPPGTDRQRGSLLGPSFDDDAIARALEAAGAPHRRLPDDDALCDEVARRLAAGRVVGWFQGRMEFGPRALGARSILGDPRRPDTRETMNLKIKFRESFRPFAPSVTRERAAEFFEIRPGEDSPYMLITAPVRREKRVEPDRDCSGLRGVALLSVPRSVIPAVTHVDHSARVQTVDAERSPLYHKLLRTFEAMTGCPVLVNTSFNVRGEPIVGHPRDALRCFLATNMDALAIGHFLLDKEDQPAMSEAEVAAHLGRFELD